MIARWRLIAWVIGVLAFGNLAAAHDLEIDQLMLWPNRGSAELRGELNVDPELTRRLDEQHTDAHGRALVELLKSNVRLSLDGAALPIDFEVRELWERGGATVGDLVVFRVPLPAAASELRVFTGEAFKALVVSVQVVSDTGAVDTASWLLGRNESTPVYRLGSGWEQAGWREGGPEIFARPSDAANPVPDVVGAAPPRDAVSAAPPRDASSAAPPRDASSVAGPLSLAARFLRLGFEHILPGGIDHMLFVAGVVLGSAQRYRRVLISLSLFTLAHTLTLALGNFRVLQVPPHVVEPLIGLSILLLGIDNLRRRSHEEKPAPARYLVVFGFGLIHGLGFANALSELAFDRQHVVLALLSFNVGVELGQIAVVVLLACLLQLLRERQVLQRYAMLVGSAAIAVSGLFMVVERFADAIQALAPTTKTKSELS